MTISNDITTKQWRDSLVDLLAGQDAPVVLSYSSPGKYRTESKDGLVRTTDARMAVSQQFGLNDASASWSGLFLTTVTDWLDKIDGSEDGQISIKAVKSKDSDALRDSLVACLHSSISSQTGITGYQESVGNFIVSLNHMQSSPVAQK